MHLTDASLANRVLPNLPRNGLAGELLDALAAGLGLGLVADHHTRSVRLPLPAGPARVGDVLTLAARKFGLVIRQEEAVLFARSRHWPDRDEEETPSPYPETWIAAKAAGGGLTLDDLQVIQGLRPAQLDALRAYRDGSVDFRLDVSLVRRNRWGFAIAESLSAQQRRLALSPTGLPVRNFTPGQRALLLRSVRSRTGWDGVALFLTLGRPRKLDGRPTFLRVALANPQTGITLVHEVLPPTPE